MNMISTKTNLSLIYKGLNHSNINLNPHPYISEKNYNEYKKIINVRLL